MKRTNKQQFGKWERALSYPDVTLLEPLALMSAATLGTITAFRQSSSSRTVSPELQEKLLCAWERVP